MTPRYVQRLFEADGTTFSEFLTRQRLARAHRLLCEPSSGTSAISTIAYDVGFGDLSYFNRCFRREYGMVLLQVGRALVTPTEGQEYVPTDGAVTVPIGTPEDP